LARVLDLARAKSIRIAVAESCTGGMLAAQLTQTAGSSDVFDRGFVTYSNMAKTDMLGVAADLISAHGAVSEPVALAMAIGALDRSNAQLTVAITGIAGPGGSEFKPEGRVCFATTRAGHQFCETVEFGALGRDAVRLAARDHALSLLLRELSAI
jgi:nicotinamide-nucleotide amidase